MSSESVVGVKHVAVESNIASLRGIRRDACGTNAGTAILCGLHALDEESKRLFRLCWQMNTALRIV